MLFGYITENTLTEKAWEDPAQLQQIDSEKSAHVASTIIQEHILGKIHFQKIVDREWFTSLFREPAKTELTKKGMSHIF